MSGLKKLAGQTAIYGLPSILARLLTFLLLPLYTGVFTEAEYGVIQKLFAYFAFGLNFMAYGMETSYFRFSSRDEWPESKVFGTIFTSITFSSCAFFMLGIAFQDQLARFINQPEGGLFVVWMSVILSLDSITAIPMGRLRKQGRAIRFGSIRFLATVLTIVLNVFWLGICPKYYLQWNLPHWLYSPEWSLHYVLVSNAFGSALALIMALLSAGNFHFKIDKGIWKSALNYGLPIMVVGLAGMANETLDRILLDRLLPAGIALREVGIYSGVYKLSMPISLFIMAFRYAAEPYFFAKYKEADNTRSYARLLTVFVAAVSMVFVAVMVNLSWLGALFLRRAGYSEGFDVVWILLLANIALGIFYNLTIWYKLTDRTMHGAWVSITGAGLTIFLNIWWIPMFSYTGSAYATLIVYSYMAAVTWWMGRKHLKVVYQWPRIFLYLTLAVSLAFVSIFFTKGQTLLFSVLVGNAFLALYALIVYLLERKNPLHKPFITAT